MNRYTWDCGYTRAGMRVHLDRVEGAEDAEGAGTFTLWARDGEKLHRAGAWSFADFGEELCAASEAQAAVEALLAGGEPDRPPRWFPPDLAACAADPIRDDPAALGA